ncbi:MAG TPA: hypothetical protein VLG93_08105, partial [Sulfuricaulis sp.]|nr:hypothetical protein [Sulfuricaulis sp.]
MNIKLVYCIAFILLTGCQEKTDNHAQLKIISEITKQAPGLMSFKDMAGDQWSRVCFFGPYTLKSTDVLGFDWEVTKKTAVGGDDA